MEGAAPPVERAFEPWPWILVALQVTMIAISLTFFTIAATHPDPEVAKEGKASSGVQVQAAPQSALADAP